MTFWTNYTSFIVKKKCSIKRFGISIKFETQQLSLFVLTWLLPCFFFNKLYIDWTFIKPDCFKMEVKYIQNFVLSFCRMYLILFQIGYFISNSPYINKQTHNLKWNFGTLWPLPIVQLGIYKIQKNVETYYTGKSISKTLQYTLGLINKLQW